MVQNLKPRLAALLFIICFFPKLGLELFEHQAFHESKQSSSFHHEQIGVNCSCLDDISMPLAKATLAVLPPVISKEIISEYNSYLLSFNLIAKSFSSLRGPPATV